MTSTARVTSVTFRISGDRHLGGSSTPLRSPPRESPRTLAKPGDGRCVRIPPRRFCGRVIVPLRDFLPGPPRARTLTQPSLHPCLFRTNRQLFLFPPGRPEGQPGRAHGLAAACRRALSPAQAGTDPRGDRPAPKERPPPVTSGIFRFVLVQRAFNLLPPISGSLDTFITNAPEPPEPLSWPGRRCRKCSRCGDPANMALGAVIIYVGQQTGAASWAVLLARRETFCVVCPKEPLTRKARRERAWRLLSAADECALALPKNPPTSVFSKPIFYRDPAELPMVNLCRHLSDARRKCTMPNTPTGPRQ